MRKTTRKTDLLKQLDKVAATTATEEKLIKAFEQLKQELEITKELDIKDSIYLNPFKLEYVGVSGGLKNYYFGIEEQQEEKKDQYVKLCIKKDGRLVVIKSFGKVSNLKQDTLNNLLLIIRLSQYVLKNRELYSLDVAIRQLLG